MPVINSQTLILFGGNGRREQFGTFSLVGGTCSIPLNLTQIHSACMEPVGTVVAATARAYYSVSLSTDGVTDVGTTTAIQIKSDWTSTSNTQQYWFRVRGF